MNKKVIICICIGIIVVGLFVGIIIHLFDKNRNEPNIESEIKQKGYNLFKKDYCTTDHSLEIAGDALTEWKCQLCGTSAINSDTNIPKLCENCAKITGRCYQCGKLKK